MRLATKRRLRDDQFLLTKENVRVSSRWSRTQERARGTHRGRSGSASSQSTSHGYRTDGGSTADESGCFSRSPVSLPSCFCSAHTPDASTSVTAPLSRVGACETVRGSDDAACRLRYRAGTM